MPPDTNTFPIAAPAEVSFTDDWHACRGSAARASTRATTCSPTGIAGGGRRAGRHRQGRRHRRRPRRPDRAAAGHLRRHLLLRPQRREPGGRGPGGRPGPDDRLVGRTGNAATTPPTSTSRSTCGTFSSDEPCTVNPFPYLQRWGQGSGGRRRGLVRARHRRLGPALGHRGRPGAGDVGRPASPTCCRWPATGTATAATVGLYQRADATFNLLDDEGVAMPPVARHPGPPGRVAHRRRLRRRRPRHGRLLPAVGRHLRGHGGRGRAVRPAAARHRVAQRHAAGGRRLGRRRPRLGGRLPAGRHDPGAVDDEGRSVDPATVPTPGGRPEGTTPSTPSRWPATGTATAATPSASCGARRGRWSCRSRSSTTRRPPGTCPPACPPRRCRWPATGTAPTWSPSRSCARSTARCPTRPRSPRACRRSTPPWQGRDLHPRPQGRLPGHDPQRERVPLRRGGDRQRPALLGRGFIQLTGEVNYRAAGQFLGVDLLGNPDLAQNVMVSPAVAAWYWTVARTINLAADELDMAAVNIAVGFAPNVRRDMVRCADFIAALRYYSGGVTPRASTAPAPRARGGWPSPPWSRRSARPAGAGPAGPVGPGGHGGPRPVLGAVHVGAARRRLTRPEGPLPTPAPGPAPARPRLAPTAPPSTPTDPPATDPPATDPPATDDHHGRPRRARPRRPRPRRTRPPPTRSRRPRPATRPRRWHRTPRRPRRCSRASTRSGVSHVQCGRERRQIVLVPAVGVEPTLDRT